MLSALHQGGEGKRHCTLMIGAGAGYGFLAEAGQLCSEIGVVKPLVECAASDSCTAGTLGIGGCRNDKRQGGELARGKATPH